MTFFSYTNIFISYQGPIGVIGPTGPIGETGPKGDQGVKGDKGDHGDKGQKVSTRGQKKCQKCDIFSQGEKGIEGKQGLRGQTGDKGDTGEVSEFKFQRIHFDILICFRQVKQVQRVVKVSRIKQFIIK